MNSRKIKQKIALSCNGDLKEYFKKVKKINEVIDNKKFDLFKNENFLHKLINN